MIGAWSSSRHAALAGVIAILAGLLISSSASAQQFQIKSIAEKKIPQLPPGPLFWRIENFPTLTQSQAAAGSTELAAEAAGEGLAIHALCEGGNVTGQYQSCGSGPCAALLCA